ncbi:hypothetical protein BEM40_023430 [Escherichia sp. MOD1-EC5451]|nr:hypothetical protein BEM40_023430 [Escherichia sp. MOD1-EC5451]
MDNPCKNCEKKLFFQILNLWSRIYIIVFLMNLYRIICPLMVGCRPELGGKAMMVSNHWRLLF